jgi:hypothetical protein
MRLRGRTDANQSSIVRDLRKLGASVAITSSLGTGYPDILVGFRGANYWFELKDPNQPPSKRALTDAEKDFHLAWSGQVHKVESVEDCMDVMCLGMNR